MPKRKFVGEAIEIAGAADIRTVSTIHARLLEALTSSDKAVVDLKNVDELDVSLLQLIESARRYAAATSKTLTLSRPAQGELREYLLRGGFLSRKADREFWLQSGEDIQ